MSIEIGSKWVKDGYVVEVKSLPYCMSINMVIFEDNTTLEHVLSVRDFFEQYKPYEIIYEYRYVREMDTDIIWLDSTFLTDEEALKFYENQKYQRLDFTKRERK